MKRWFVTGTDTGIGKTTASCVLLKAASNMGFSVAGYKPVAFGCKVTDSGIRSADALKLQSYSNVLLNYQEINPFAFLDPFFSYVLEDNEKKIIFSELSSGLHMLEKRAEWILVEGAGGWYTPLSSKKTYADWVIYENIPVILVVGIKLGCINHAILTMNAIREAGLSLTGWIANIIQPTTNKLNSLCISALNHFLKVSYLGTIPWLESLEEDIYTCAKKIILPE